MKFDKFDYSDIRPYRDSEIRTVLDRLIAGPHLVDVFKELGLKKYFKKFVDFCRKGPWPLPLFETNYLNPELRRRLVEETKHVKSVQDIIHYSERIVDKNLRDTTTHLNVHGLKNVVFDKKGIIILSNHRMIFVDPMYASYSIYMATGKSPELAIGDNLYNVQVRQKDGSHKVMKWIEDVMRANGGFTIKRSKDRRSTQKYRDALHASRYVNWNVERGVHTWSALGEGRTFDGNDQAHKGIFSMLYLARKDEMSFTEFMNATDIYTCSISYENDPTDVEKARRAFILKRDDGVYKKYPGEDGDHMIKEFQGDKGEVSIVYRKLEGQFASPIDAAQGVTEQIAMTYLLTRNNEFAVDLIDRLENEVPILVSDEEIKERANTDEKLKFRERLLQCAPEWRPYFIKQYAMPILNKAKYVM